MKRTPLMIKISRRSPSRGFSLIEVTLSIGIISFAILSLVGLLGIALGSSKDSTQTTRLTTIAQRIFSDAESATWTKGDQGYKYEPTPLIRYFDVEGEELVSGSSPHVYFIAQLVPSRIEWPSDTVPSSSMATNLIVEIKLKSQTKPLKSYSMVIARRGL